MRVRGRVRVRLRIELSLEPGGFFSGGDILLEPFIPCIKIYCLSFQPIEVWRENLDKTYVSEGVLLGIFKAFDCVSYYILFANFLAYGVDDTLQIPDSHYEKKILKMST